jgi:hypothetical protein
MIQYTLMPLLMLGFKRPKFSMSMSRPFNAMNVMTLPSTHAIPTKNNAMFAFFMCEALDIHAFRMCANGISKHRVSTEYCTMDAVDCTLDAKAFKHTLTQNARKKRIARTPKKFCIGVLQANEISYCDIKNAVQI